MSSPDDTTKPEPEPDADPAPPAEPPAVPAAVRSRAFGCLIFVVGAVLLAAILAGFLVFGALPKKVFAALLAFGTTGLMFGLGMILFPWTEEMFALNQQDNFGKMYRAMPPVWKVWFVLVLVVLLGVMFAALILA